ncbi:TPM domain-containing protein [Aquamicrobium sp. LC103]|uniref:TPM domain-containing protein n=1 Tax=Aquamicrobium sp. LC103 TaxID=1120658 RepID=UPI00063EABA4|nr:TPM domain-containing protein [Aquamicrobium sp. LC103]TKT82942.1 TPM domain-containing protein [Aquamicrobium sp. LC103]
MTKPLTDEQRLALSEAIREAEERTSGEIYCVVARTSDSYFYPAAFVLALGMLIISQLVAFVLDRDWADMSIAVFAAAQILAFAAALGVIWVFPALRIFFVPRRLRYLRAHDNALKQFLAHNIHLTSRRTGILIFVSLAEHYAEVLADDGISARVDQEEWNAIVAVLVKNAREDRLFDGLSQGIRRAGLLLSEHFPDGDDNPNELPDRVVEI